MTKPSLSSTVFYFWGVSWVFLKQKLNDDVSVQSEVISSKAVFTVLQFVLLSRNNRNLQRAERAVAALTVSKHQSLFHFSAKVSWQLQNEQKFLKGRKKTVQKYLKMDKTTPKYQV